MTEAHQRVADYIRNHPDESFQTIATKLGVAYSTISRIAKTAGLSREPGLKLETLNLEELPQLGDES